MKEYDRIVDEAWQAIGQRRAQVFRLVGDLWEAKYKYKYIQWILERKQRMAAAGGDWERFAR